MNPREHMLGFASRHSCERLAIGNLLNDISADHELFLDHPEEGISDLLLHLLGIDLDGIGKANEDGDFQILCHGLVG